MFYVQGDGSLKIQSNVFVESKDYKTTTMRQENYQQAKS